MKIEYNKEYRRAFIFFVFTAFVILLFLPREGKFQYDYQKGKPWNYDNLIATFDFPIYKSTQELLEEQKQINDHFSVYYICDTLIDKVQLSLLETALPDKDEWKGLKTKVLSAFEKIYNKGIVNDGKINGQIISVVKGNVSSDYPMSDVFTTLSANEYIKNTLQNINHQDELTKFLNGIELKQYICPNLLYNEKLTVQVKENRLENLLPTKGMVMKGDKIIGKGEIVSAVNYQILESLRKEYEENVGFAGNWTLLLIGQFLFIATCLIAIFVLLSLFRREILLKPKYLYFLIILINLICITSLLVLRNNKEFIYVYPFTILPIYIATFFYSRPALFIHWILIILIGNFVPNSFEFIFLNSIAAITAIWGFKHLYKRGQLFLAVFLIFITYGAGYLSLTLLQEGNITTIQWQVLLAFAGNSLLIIILYQFTFIFEKLFGFLSDSRLIELSDSNQKVLRELAEVAPGTFQHSLQVANLAEAAIRKIGGNVLLVRAGALYHDIGKTKNPIFFIENQNSAYNPHEALTPEESAAIIIEHVTYGIELARKAKLPETIIDFIRTHHANSKTYYFYAQYKVLHPDAREEDIVPLFTYHGECPRTKETAVVMIADAAEAASRSLKQVSKESISEMIDKIVDFQLNEGYFNEADITLAELSIVKEVIKSKLQNIHHNRIEYPEMRSRKNSTNQ